VSRSFFDRIMRPVKPRPTADFAPPPRELATGLWRIERRVRLPGAMVLPAGMTIIRLPSGKLFLHSPLPFDEGVSCALAELGEVSVVLAPNSFHYVFIADYVARFPAAKLFLAPRLRERIASLPPAPAVDGEAPSEWEGAVTPIVFGPVGFFSEVALFHQATSTLILADLAFNMIRYRNALDRLAWRLFGVPAGFGPSRTGRFSLLRDRAAAGPFLRRMLEHDFRRILVAHGDPVETNARAEFERAFRRYLSAPQGSARKSE
jgi:hypothetical protein